MKTIFQEISDYFDLGEVLEYKKIEEGALNENYLIITNAGKYFAKGIRSKAKERLGYISMVEEYMLERGIPAICMIKAKDGNTLYIKDEIYFSVYPFVESDRSHKYSADDLYKMGNLLAKIHKAGKSPIPEELKKYPFKATSYENKTRILNEYKVQIQNKVVKDEIDELFLDYINLKFDSLLVLGEVKLMESDTLIHGDYHAGNLLFDKDSRKIVGVCDWEKSEYSPRAYELARSIFYICFSVGFDKEKGFIDAGNFIKGYQDEYEVSKEFLIGGLMLRLRQTGLSTWLEDGYYKDGNPKNNKFISNEMELMNLFVMGDGVEKLKEII